MQGKVNHNNGASKMAKGASKKGIEYESYEVEYEEPKDGKRRERRVNIRADKDTLKAIAKVLAVAVTAIISYRVIGQPPDELLPLD